MSSKIIDFIDGNIEFKTQDESQATFCKKIKKEDGEIDPESNNATLNWNKYRAYFGWPGVFFFKNNKRIKIIEAIYENDSFVIKRVIPEGKKEISYDEFLKQSKKEDRIIFVRRYWYTDSISDIASAMHVSESKIKSVLFRMRKKLQIRLVNEGCLYEE